MRAPAVKALMILTPAVFAGLVFGQASSTQTPSTRVIGEVTTLAPASGQISLKTDRGDAVTVVVVSGAALRKVPPGVQDLTGATRIDFSAIAVGDRVLAIGQSSADQKKIEARSVIVMSRSDLDQKRQAEQEDWRKRGVSGTVSAIDAEGKAFTVQSGPRSLTIQPAAKAEYRRYAPDSVRFSDARPSSLAELKIGDQVRALGEKSGDGGTILAERIVSGSFRQIAATIVSLNAGTGEIVVRDLATKTTLTVRVNADSTMRRLPPALAAAIGRRYQAAGARDGAGDVAPSARAGGGEEIGQMLERLPAMPLSDLKAGDAIMLSSTVGSDPARVTAVMLLAGVEPLLTASPTATRDIMSGWNLGGDEGPP
jgi:hypothetical protein